MNVLYVNK